MALSDKLKNIHRKLGLNITRTKHRRRTHYLVYVKIINKDQPRAKILFDFNIEPYVRVTTKYGREVAKDHALSLYYAKYNLPYDYLVFFAHKTKIIGRGKKRDPIETQNEPDAND